MKLKKLVLVVVILLVVALPVLCYAGITLTNNYLAQRIEKELAAHQLPEGTALVDSLSAAGKLVGNGNGMQYMGSILVESELSREELLSHYSSRFEYIEVREQSTANLDFINAGHCRFDGFSEGKTCYSVTCWDSNREKLVGSFIGSLLDMDIRGH